MKPNLQSLRKQAGYKSAKVYAEHMGLNVGSYTNYEQGVRPLPIDVAWDIADDLGCSLDELFGRDFTPEPPESDYWVEDGRRLIFEAYDAMNDEGRAELEHQASMMSTHPAYAADDDG